MNVSPSKENILKKIRKALSHSTPIPFPSSEGNSSVYHPSRQELEVEFAERFSLLLGRFAYCANSDELLKQLQALIQLKQWKNIHSGEEKLSRLLMPVAPGSMFSEDLGNCDAAVTGCECLVARTGSIVLSSAQEGGRTTSVYAPVHICIATIDQLVYDIRDGFQLMKEKYGSNLPSMISFATGPSRTADIEKTLVVGVHGPKEVYVFLVEELDSL